MLHLIKQKLDLYLDTFSAITTQALNSPKTVPTVITFGFGISMADINGALGIASGVIAVVTGGIVLWGAVEKRIDSIKSRREKRALRRQELINEKLKTKSLENHIKKQAK